MSTIRYRRGTAAAWTAANPLLLSGEPGFATDTGDLRIGNGTDPWVDLESINGGGAGGGVTSVNGDVGDVTLAAADVGADAAGAAATAQAFAIQRGNHTGTQSADTITDGATNKAYTAAEKTKLAGVAANATANSSDATLEARANHTGTQTASTISDFSTAADARVAAARGVSVQAYDADLDAFASKTAPTGAVVGTSDAQTLTNKRVTKRVDSTASTATYTFNADSFDAANITAQAAGLTIANPSGTPTAMQGLLLRVKDNGTAQTIAFGTAWRALGVTLPTTTVVGKTVYLGAVWNSADSVWDVIAVGQQA